MDEVDDKKREWDAIYEKERARRKNIDELKKIVDGMGEKERSSKSLLKLAVYTNGIKASDAADILGVKRGIINAWIEYLLDREFVEVESMSHPNPTIKPTAEIVNKFKAYQMRKVKLGKKRLEEDIKDLEKAVDDRQDAESEPAVNPVKEEPEEIEIELEPGLTYLISDDKSAKSMKLFIKRIRAGVKGLLVTRSNPNLIRKKYYLQDSKVVWLTSVQTDREIESISGLQELSILISNFIDENEKAIIVLEGVEYLISNNNFQVVLRLIQQLKDKVSTADSNMLLPVNPASLEDKQLTLLKNECQTIGL